ncbi:MAG: DUF6265 family protein [Saprospiraceae bacterium]
MTETMVETHVRLKLIREKMRYFVSMKNSGFVCCFLIISIIFFLPGCSPKVKPFNWLVGTWEMRRSAGGTRLEIWSPYHEESLVGLGLIFTDKDTTMLEQIQLEFREPDYFYIATVPEQNNGQPIEFKLVKSEVNKYTFENALHDFPQRIVYQFKPIAEQDNIDLRRADSLLVRVESLDGNGIEYGFARK